MSYKQIKTPQEIDTLVSLIREIWPEVFIPIIGKAQVDYMLVHYQGKDIILSEIENGRQYFFIKYAGAPVGYFAYNLEEDYLYISKVYLKKEFRGKGLSTKVFDYFEETARASSKKKLFLRVNRKNKQAIDIYLHRGFVITESIDEPLGNFVLNDYCMEMPLARQA
ncbi:MAG: GNAT family N-acetyltransferase [Treponema sp.]|jgi:GNAT superfamily N-acetyltransferase|nr:GNAT family N-acetyltransferase [Treponema sp.]